MQTTSSGEQTYYPQPRSWWVSLLLTPLLSLIDSGEESVSEDPAQLSQRFKSALANEYGDHVPQFLECSFQDAMQAAIDEFKFLFVCIHCFEHQDADIYGRCLCTEQVTNYLSENCLAWGASVDQSQGQEASTLCSAASYPFLAVYRMDGAQKFVEVKRYEPSSPPDPPVTAQQIIDFVEDSIRTGRSALDGIRARQIAIQQDREVREEQEIRYEQMLERDREIRQKKRAEREAEIKHKEYIENAMNNYQYILKRVQTIQEPLETDPRACTIRLTFPSGTRVQRRFDANDTLQTVKEYAICVIESCGYLALDLQLAATITKQVWSGNDAAAWNMTLQEANLHPQGTLVVTPLAIYQLPQESSLVDISYQDK